ncbi:MAG: DHH family phosphoesterase, partial [Patescibacteria group bacterium]
PAVAGEVNKETKLIFEKAGVDLPEVIDLEGRDLFLVDHNETGQMAGDPKNVIGVLDHHNLSDFSTDKAIYFRNEPLGSTSSLIARVASEKELELEEKEIFLLLCGIISDTLKFNSPTTTEYDKALAQDLADIVDEDIDQLAEEMFKAKSDLSDMTMKEVIEADYKPYEFGGKEIGVGVAEVATTSFFEGKEEEIVENMKKVKEEKGLDHLFFGVIDILNKDTLLYTCSEEDKDLAKETFEIEEDKIPAILKGVASRKKQIIPPLSKKLKN